MERIAIKPDLKLKTKLHLFTLSLLSIFVFTGVILQFTLPLGRISYSDVAIVVWPIVFGILLIGWLIAAPIIHLWVNNLEYFIEDDRIIIHKGIITKIQQNIPYRAITDFMLHRSLYDRILKMGSIRIQTAGQAVTPTGYEANLGGLINYDELLSELRSRLRKVNHESSPLTTQNVEGATNENVMQDILNELKLIRAALEDKK